MNDPYRPYPPSPNPELERIAREGQARRMMLEQQQHVMQRSSGDRHLRTAIGAYRGSLVQRILMVGIFLGLLLIATGALGSWALRDTELSELAGSLGGAGFMMAFACFMVRVFVPPLATNGAIMTEQNWMTSLPFALGGYFETLSQEPRRSTTLVFQITWKMGTRPPDPNLLANVLAAADPQSRLEHVDANGASFASGAIDGTTGIRVNNSPVFRNHRFAARVHAFVDALIPLNQSHPIYSVVMSPR